jgi:peptidoglycan/xylan/chitin deacetylase (PgdA/CDA1 family)
LITWTIDPRDWEEGDPDDVVDRALTPARAGQTILLHDGLDPGDKIVTIPTFDRVETVDRILGGLQDRELAGTSMSRLLASGSAQRELWFYE